MSTLPCTVGILTRNSGATLARALQSVRDFSDILICDGGSTDSTLDIARAHGARIIPQDTRCLDSEGRIIDYAGLRNQTLQAAQEQWFFFLDSDEYLTPELVEDIRGAVQGPPMAFWIPRTYTWGGHHIACATTYPNKQMRLFHTDVADRFIKKVHESIMLLPDTKVETLPHGMIVPLDTTPGALWRKWDTYIALGEGAQPSVDLYTFIWMALKHIRASLLFAIRHMGILVLCRGPRLPLWRELAEHRYNIKVIRGLWRRLDITYGA